MLELRTAALSLVGVLALVALATGLLAWTGAPKPFAPALAVLRGTLQLAAISLVLSGIIHSALWIGAALVVMFAVASWTAARRLGALRERLTPVAVAMGAGILITLAIVFLTGAIEFSPRYVLAIGGIVIGNAMTIATLSGRRFVELVDDRWEDVEGWLALGATPRVATRDLVRRAIHAAMVPTTDQTRTTGLVTLPGAFVGAVFGGVSPLEAGRFQIVVLAAIIGCGAIVATVLTAWLAPVRVRPGALAS
jgi:putative ABC transport system permease protein